MCVCLCRCVHTHVRGRIYIYIYTHTCMGAHTYVCRHVCAYIQLKVSQENLSTIHDFCKLKNSNFTGLSLHFNFFVVGIISGIFLNVVFQKTCLILFTNPSARAGYDTRSIFKRSLTGLNSEFSFSKTSYLTKTEEPSLSYYLTIAGGRIIGFIPFPKVLVLCEMQLFSSRI